MAQHLQKEERIQIQTLLDVGNSIDETENSPKHYIKISQLLESANCSSWESSFLLSILETRR